MYIQHYRYHIKYKECCDICVLELCYDVYIYMCVCVRACVRACVYMCWSCVVMYVFQLELCCDVCVRIRAVLQCMYVCWSSVVMYVCVCVCLCVCWSCVVMYVCGCGAVL